LRIAAYAAAAGITAELPASDARAQAIAYLSGLQQCLGIDLETLRRTADITPLLTTATFDPASGWVGIPRVPLGFPEAQKRAEAAESARRAEVRAMREYLTTHPLDQASLIGEAARAGWNPRSVAVQKYTDGRMERFGQLERAVAAFCYLRDHQHA
jgi:hypothetical protein